MVPEYANMYSAFTVTHTCSLNLKDMVEPEDFAQLDACSSEQKLKFFLGASEMRVRFKAIVDNVFSGHCYQMPDTYGMRDLFLDLVALSVFAGTRNAKLHKDVPLVFNVEKQAFVLCARNRKTG